MPNNLFYKSWEDILLRLNSELSYEALEEVLLHIQARNQEAYERFAENFSKTRTEASETSKHYLQKFLACLEGQHEKVIVDIGCGTGADVLYLSQLPNLKVYGTEIVDGLIRSLSSKNDFTFLKAKAESLPFADGSLDGVIHKASLHHYPYLPDHALGVNAVIRESCRVLKPKGCIFILVRHGKERFVEAQSDRFFQLYSEDDIYKLANAFKLDVVGLTGILDRRYRDSSWQPWLFAILQKSK